MMQLHNYTRNKKELAYPAMETQRFRDRLKFLQVQTNVSDLSFREIAPQAKENKLRRKFDQSRSLRVGFN